MLLLVNGGHWALRCYSILKLKIGSIIPKTLGGIFHNMGSA